MRMYRKYHYTTIKILVTQSLLSEKKTTWRGIMYLWTP
jgi:hypothetical protein